MNKYISKFVLMSAFAIAGRPRVPIIWTKHLKQNMKLPTPIRTLQTSKAS